MKRNSPWFEFWLASVAMILIVGGCAEVVL